MEFMMLNFHLICNKLLIQIQKKFIYFVVKVNKVSPFLRVMKIWSEKFVLPVQEKNFVLVDKNNIYLFKASEDNMIRIWNINSK